MSPYFSNYVSNFQRVSLCEILENEGLSIRKSQARASLVVNPLTGRPYASIELTAAEPANSEQCVIRLGARQTF